MHKVFSELQTSDSDPYSGLRPSPFHRPNIKYARFTRSTPRQTWLTRCGAAAASLSDLVVTIAVCMFEVALAT